MHDAWVAGVTSPTVQCGLLSDVIASPEKYLLIMKFFNTKSGAESYIARKKKSFVSAQSSPNYFLIIRNNKRPNSKNGS